MDNQVQAFKPENSVGRLISEKDVYLFREGTLYESYSMLGARPVLNSTGQIDGYYFALWAPNAVAVSVVGDWNGWQPGADAMTRVEDSGIWELYIEGVGVGWTYKYAVTAANGKVTFKADPYARFAELRPATASRTWYDNYKWHDGVYRIKKGAVKPYDQPMVIYEMHLGSWIRSAEGEMLSYREIADKLARYAEDNGYTHVEIMPIAEHPYDGSWGYQVTGFYAPTSRYGTPEDFKYFVDTLHSKGIGVIMDWVPAHFPKDDYGLASFDGTPLYEYADSRAQQKRWGTLKFDLGKPEVRSFLISNAMFWLSEYHLDGLRVDAVSCMLYLDFDADGDWTPNCFGGRENLQAVDFIKQLNTVVYSSFPNAIMVAEEASDYPKVTSPVSEGGLGFGFKWNMGWMNDTVKYMELDPIFRRGSHNLMTFSMMYAYNENYILPLSHDENVHGKKTVLDKMSGDYWQKFASLKAYLGYMFAHPGKKLTFMGSELGQFMEWRYYEDIEWELLRYETHRGIYMFNRALINLYRNNPAFWENDTSWDGFTWCNADDGNNSVLSFIRKGKEEQILAVINFTPVERYDYWVGMPEEGTWEKVLSSDDKCFGGNGFEVLDEVTTDAYDVNGHKNRLRINLPGLSVVFYRKKI